jgi:hypothetical protein
MYGTEATFLNIPTILPTANPTSVFLCMKSKLSLLYLITHRSYHTLALFCIWDSSVEVDTSSNPITTIIFAISNHRKPYTLPTLMRRGRHSDLAEVLTMLSYQRQPMGNVDNLFSVQSQKALLYPTDSLTLPNSQWERTSFCFCLRVRLFWLSNIANRRLGLPSNHKKPYFTQQPLKRGVTLFLPENERVLSQQYSQ